MYEKLHEDVMATPLPEAVRSARLGPLFEGAMRLRYIILLEKAVGVLDRTVAMVERTQERSGWADRARDARARLGRRLAEENRAVDALPHSRESLGEVLLELQRRQGPSDGPGHGEEGSAADQRKNRAESRRH
jgi:hypothetical protein